MSDAFESLKILLTSNGYGQVVNTLTREEICDFIREEVLNDEIDLSKSFQDNKETIETHFYEKNYPVSLYRVFSEKDVEELYGLIKELIKK